MPFLWLHILLHRMPFSKQCSPIDMQLEWQGQLLSLLCRTQPVFPPSCSLFQHKWESCSYTCEISSCFLRPSVLQFVILNCPLLRHIGRSSHDNLFWKYFLPHHSTTAYDDDDGDDDDIPGFLALFKIVKLGMEPFLECTLFFFF